MIAMKIEDGTFTCGSSLSNSIPRMNKCYLNYYLLHGEYEKAAEKAGKSSVGAPKGIAEEEHAREAVEIVVQSPDGPEYVEKTVEVTLSPRSDVSQ